MDRALLLDTNVAAAPIHQFLVGAGYEVHVVGRNPHDFLAKASEHYINLDYSDVEATLALVEELDARHVVPGCNDLSYMTCAAIGARRPLAGVDGLEASHTLLNKRAFRRYAAANGLPAPREIAAGEVTPAQPVIVKPVDAYSGRGVTVLKAPTPPALAAAITEAKRFSAAGDCIVEEFVQGQLYSHTAFIDATGLAADFIVEEYGSMNPFTVDTSRVVFDFEPLLLAKIRAAIKQIGRDLRLRPGLIHTQFISNGDQLWIIEITRRCPGDLYSQLIALSTGFAYAENYARPFVGAPLKPASLSPAPIMRHTLSVATEQTFGSLQFHQPVDLAAFVPQALAGDRLLPSPFSRIGILFARAATDTDLDSLMGATLRGELYTVLGPDGLAHD